MKRIHYISKLKQKDKVKEEKLTIKIPAGTKINVEKLTIFVPILSRNEIIVKVLIEDSTKYTFKLPKSTRMAWVLKDNVELIK